jgi:hypothetical protein
MGHKNIGVSFDETIQCVTDSFDGPNQLRADNLVLKGEAEGWKKYGSGYWPSVVINDRTYRGDLVPDNVLNAVCAGFANQPDVCKKFLESQGLLGEPEGVTGNVLIFVVVLLVLVNVAMIILYKRCTNKELKDDM